LKAAAPQNAAAFLCHLATCFGAIHRSIAPLWCDYLKFLRRENYNAMILLGFQNWQLNCLG
jgi:hypothetical protein